MEKRNVLVVGGGAREHALAGALAREGHAVTCAPGNGGTAPSAPVDADDPGAVVALARRLAADLVVVGPEKPLVAGVADALEAAGVAVFGPSRAAARLEGSKAFMKEFCTRHGVPTADYRVFDDADAAEAHVRRLARPLVVKADGLAAGKGVVVAKTTDEALAAVRASMRERAFGEAGARVVIEEILPGEEASFHVVCSGTSFVPLAAAQDHKRAFDRDQGPNTGGMGAYAPAPIVDASVREKVLRRVVEPTLAGLAAEGCPMRGVLFVGLMIEAGEPRVLEFNVRFGDPETGVLVPLYAGSWFELLDAAARGTLTTREEATRPGRHALSVVMAAESYPAAPRTGDPIEGLESVQDATILHAGTKRANDSVLTAGGRVLNVVAEGATLAEARARAYAAVARIHWRGEHHRTDIGARALR